MLTPPPRPLGGPVAARLVLQGTPDCPACGEPAASRETITSGALVLRVCSSCASDPDATQIMNLLDRTEAR